jgi:hypothetical protein
MATEILVKDPLEKEWIDGGQELLNRLAKADFKIVAALWLWERETSLATCLGFWFGDVAVDDAYHTFILSNEKPLC